MITKIIGNQKKYIADKGKRVKFLCDKRLYTEIVVPLDDEREVVEVEAEKK